MLTWKWLQICEEDSMRQIATQETWNPWWRSVSCLCQEDQRSSCNPEHPLVAPTWLVAGKAGLLKAWDSRWENQTKKALGILEPECLVSSLNLNDTFPIQTDWPLRDFTKMFSHIDSSSTLPPEVSHICRICPCPTEATLWYCAAASVLLLQSLHYTFVSLFSET